MFEFILSAYRRLQAAINREAAAIEETASLRETLNAGLRAAIEDRGIVAPAPIGDDVPMNRIAATNGKKHTAKA